MELGSPWLPSSLDHLDALSYPTSRTFYTQAEIVHWVSLVSTWYQLTRKHDDDDDATPFYFFISQREGKERFNRFDLITRGID